MLANFLCPHQILKEDVDLFKPGNENNFPDECQLIVKWVQEHKTPVYFMHKINLIGAKPPRNYFRLNLDPEWEGIMHCS